MTFYYTDKSVPSNIKTGNVIEPVICAARVADGFVVVVKELKFEMVGVITDE